MKDNAFHSFAHRTSVVAGSPWAFSLALLTIVVWAVTGKLFNYSDTWQLVINTGTTIVTFLMVFLIQNTQNRDSQAILLKLDELIRSNQEARNTFLDLEEMSEEELKRYHQEFTEMREKISQRDEEHMEAIQKQIKERQTSAKKSKAASKSPVSTSRKSKK